jgi:kynurenine formamidase
MSTSFDDLPAYDDLPIDPSAPAASSWGVFGPDDQVGTVNLLTADRVRSAAQLVRKGAVFSLNLDLEQPDPPLSGRRPMKHTIGRDAVSTDDWYDDFFPQRSSQWDALCHVGHPEHGFYNGCRWEDITGRPGSRNGIENWARRGISGRFVLADIGRYFEREGKPLDHTEDVAVGADDLAAVLADQGVALQGGDILLLRFGFLTWYHGTDADGRAYAAGDVTKIGNPGLSPDESTARWLWDNHVAAVATDNAALEKLPIDTGSVDTFLHFRVIAMLGIAVGELFDLDALAADCAEDGVYEGMFAAAPLNKVGGSGSPANALAFK